MATVVQHAYTTTVATSPGTVALPLSATAGNTIVLVVGWQDASALNLPTPTDANGTYSTAFNGAQSTHFSSIAVFYVPNCSTGTHSSTIQGNFTAPDTNFFCTVAIYEISGLLSAPLDAVSAGGATDNGGAGQTSQVTGASGVLSQANEFALVAMSFDDNPGVSNEGVLVPSGYTVDPNIPSNFQDTSNFIGLQIGWKELASTASTNPSFTWASQPNMTATFAVIATFKESAAAGDTSSNSNFLRDRPGLRLRTPVSRLRSVSYRDTVGANVTVAITGQSATFTAGTMTPNSSVAITGQSATFTAGTFVPNSAVAITGQSASFTAGSMVISSALAISGLTATFSPGTLLPNISVALSGQTATFTAGTVTATNNVTVSITGQTATFTAGTVSPAIDLPIAGQSIVSTQGSLSPASSVAITATTATFAAGTLAPALGVALQGQTATFTSGTMVIPGDVTVSITGITASFTAGQMSVPGAASQDAGSNRSYRFIYRVTIDGVVFEFATYQQAIALLGKAKETARKRAQDQAMWTIQPGKPIKPPVITVSSRQLRAAANQTKREIVEIYEKEMQIAEMRMLLEIAQRKTDDDDSLMLLM